MEFLQKISLMHVLLVSVSIVLSGCQNSRGLSRLTTDSSSVSNKKLTKKEELELRKIEAELENIQLLENKLQQRLLYLKAINLKKDLKVVSEPLQLVGRPGGCPGGSPCPKEGECIDIKPVGDGIGWDGNEECLVPDELINSQQRVFEAGDKTKNISPDT